MAQQPTTQQNKTSTSIFTSIKRIFTGTDDLLSILEEDHKPLKELIEVMKDSEKPLNERKQAFMEFAPLLITHAKPEELALYAPMKKVSDLKEPAFEGDTEHMLADQLCEEIKRTTDDDAIGAKIKVLAEMVDHHIKEEENDMFPEIRKHMNKSKLIELSEIYINAQAEIIANGQDDAPAEKNIHQ